MVVASLGLVGSANAELVPLNCTAKDGRPVEIAVDLAVGRVIFGASTFTLIDESKKYISAYLPPFRIAGQVFIGEIWVLDRESGIYKQAAVHAQSDNSDMQVRVFEGRCNTPLHYHSLASDVAPSESIWLRKESASATSNAAPPAIRGALGPKTAGATARAAAPR
jgi:hypothetical protein